MALSALNFHNGVLLSLNFLFIFSHTIRYVGFWFLHQGSNPHPLHWKLSLNHRTIRDLPAQFQTRKKKNKTKPKHSCFHFFPLERRKVWGVPRFTSLRCPKVHTLLFSHFLGDLTKSPICRCICVPITPTLVYPTWLDLSSLNMVL